MPVSVSLVSLRLFRLADSTTDGSLETLRLQPLDWFDAQKPPGSAARAQIDKLALDTAAIVAADVVSTRPDRPPDESLMKIRYTTPTWSLL